MNEWRKKCVGLQRTWVSKRTVHSVHLWFTFPIWKHIKWPHFHIPHNCWVFGSFADETLDFKHCVDRIFDSLTQDFLPNQAFFSSAFHASIQTLIFWFLDQCQDVCLERSMLFSICFNWKVLQLHYTPPSAFSEVNSIGVSCGVEKEDDSSISIRSGTQLAKSHTAEK